jgi:hypothetical protein
MSRDDINDTPEKKSPGEGGADTAVRSPERAKRLPPLLDIDVATSFYRAKVARVREEKGARTGGTGHIIFGEHITGYVTSDAQTVHDTAPVATDKI